MLNTSSYDTLNQYVCDSFRNNEPCNTPFDHWEIGKLLDDNTIDAIAALPFTPFVAQWSEGYRDQHNALRTYFDVDNRLKYPVIDNIAHAFQDSQTIRIINNITNIDLTGTYLRIEYAMDVDGFWLRPHTDIGAKKFTLLLYLQSDEGCNLGTDLYDTEENLIKSARFEPGNALFFIPSDISFHGFERRDFKGIRRSLIINYVGEEWRAREQLAFPDQKVSL